MSISSPFWGRHCYFAPYTTSLIWHQFLAVMEKERDDRAAAACDDTENTLSVDRRASDSDVMNL